MHEIINHLPRVFSSYQLQKMTRTFHGNSVVSTPCDEVYHFINNEPHFRMNKGPNKGQVLYYICMDLMCRHSSEIRCLCLMKCSCEMLQNLSYFWDTKAHDVVFFKVFHIVLLYFVSINGKNRIRIEKQKSF